jgi:hypothetical protein
VDGERVVLDAGHTLTVAADGKKEVQLAPEDLQRELARFPDPKLTVASAQEVRVDIAENLFRNIVIWDRYAGAIHIQKVLQPPYQPEIRQTAEAFAEVNRAVGRTGTLRTQPFAAANAVPLVSPASASVQNVIDVGVGGLTASFLNRQAATLLQATGSRGLGFGGLRQLAIPGFSLGGRTIGPAGLAGLP